MTIIKNQFALLISEHSDISTKFWLMNQNQKIKKTTKNESFGTIKGLTSWLECQFFIVDLEIIYSICITLVILIMVFTNYTMLTFVNYLRVLKMIL